MRRKLTTGRPSTSPVNSGVSGARLSYAAVDADGTTLNLGWSEPGVSPVSGNVTGLTVTVTPIGGSAVAQTVTATASATVKTISPGVTAWNDVVSVTYTAASGNLKDSLGNSLPNSSRKSRVALAQPTPVFTVQPVDIATVEGIPAFNTFSADYAYEYVIQMLVNNTWQPVKTVKSSSESCLDAYFPNSSGPYWEGIFKVVAINRTGQSVDSNQFYITVVDGSFLYLLDTNGNMIGDISGQPFFAAPDINTLFGPDGYPNN